MISSPKLMYTLFLYCLIAILNPAIWSGPTAQAKPPPPPVQCNQTGCTLTNSYGAWGSDRDYCQVTNVTYPKTEEELRLAVAYASQHKLKVKVVSKFSHTIPKLACPGLISPGGSGANFLISTENYDTGIEVDAANLVVTAEAGVALRQLIDEVEGVGLSLVAAPAWEGVSVGGVISTGAHGSSWWGKGGALHDHVVGIRIVVPAEASHGYAKILSLEAKDSLLNAAKVSLGLLGVISKVTIN